MATRFGRAGGGAWSASGTWSASSGGASDGAGLNAGDDVVLDANSTGTFTIDTTISIVSLECTGFVGTLVHNAVTLTVSGNDAAAPGGRAFRLVSGMTYSPASTARIVTFTATSGTTSITSGGKTFGSLVINGTGGTFVPTDAVNARSDSGIVHTAGTFDLSVNNVATTTGSFTATGAGTRTLSMGSGTFTCNTLSSTVWDLSGTNITFNANTSTLLISSAMNFVKSINLGTSKTYNVLTFVNSGTVAYEHNITGTTVTIATWNITAPCVLRFVTASTYTVTNALNWSGTSATVVNVCIGSAQLLIISSAATSTAQWVVLGNLTYSGGGSFTATNSFSAGGLTGITVSGPSGAASVIGG